MPQESESITAIKLTRAVFESVHGNLGLLKFNIEELQPANGADKEESKRWKIICSFYETLGSSSASRYEVNVDLNDKTVRIKKINSDIPTPEKKYRFTQEKK